jgi:hypothetical protein
MCIFVLPGASCLTRKATVLAALVTLVLGTRAASYSTGPCLSSRERWLRVAERLIVAGRLFQSKNDLLAGSAIVAQRSGEPGRRVGNGFRWRVSPKLFTDLVTVRPKQQTG